MSKIKHPRQKKDLSLDRDRRNCYGENHAASLKGIRRGKQRRLRDERRGVKQLLKAVPEGLREDVQSEIISHVKDSKSRGHKKIADKPLRTHIDIQRERLQRRLSSRAE